ncbi:MAG: hypothetical protein IPK77_09705 [Cellvibrio sp.]|nr:hypothetical protein [Cellvibrio sp.]
MNFKFLTISEVCETLRWGDTTYYTRRAAGLFPMPINLCGSKKGNLYLHHEIEFYIKRAMLISDDKEFKRLAQEIEQSRVELAA